MHLGLALICRQRHLKNGRLVLGSITQTKTLPSITKGGLYMIKSKTRKTSKPLFQSPKTQTFKYYNPYEQINVNMLSFIPLYNLTSTLQCFKKTNENNHTQIAILTTITLSYSTSTPWWNSKSQTLKTLKEVHHFATQLKGLENFNIWLEIFITPNFSSYHSPFLTRGQVCS